MVTTRQASSGKGHRDENFPVASWLIRPELRPALLVFYRFARAADDIADHPDLAPDTKLTMLDRMEEALLGRCEEECATPLRAALAERGLGARHAQDLLKAFRLDVTRRRYETWGELMGYCALSAMPVGRFVLDLHGEDERIWPASDALCAALQVINHLQDCGKDFRDLDRVYLPLEDLRAQGADVRSLAESASPPELRACIAALADRCRVLLEQSAPLPRLVADTRLALEIATIRRLAVSLAQRLKRRDPLGERVHAGKLAFLATGLAGAVEGLLSRTAVAGRSGIGTRMRS